MVGLAWIIGQAGTIVLIWSRLRRQPPISEDLARNYATKMELSNALRDWKETCLRNHDHLDSRLKSDRGEIDQVEREQFILIRSGQTELRNIIQGLQTSLAEWQRGVERQIGAIEERTSRK
jgi:phage terminase large subunit-like protein